MARQYQLKNIFFVPLQEAGTFNAFLNMADVHMVLQKAITSDLVLPSKLMTILAVGGATIVTAVPNTSLYNMIHTFNLGIVIAPEVQSDLDSAISTAINTDLQSMRKNARLYAEQHLSIHAILSAFSYDVFNIIVTAQEKKHSGIKIC